jgi:hypothetical protein
MFHTQPLGAVGKAPPSASRSVAEAGAGEAAERHLIYLTLLSIINSNQQLINSHLAAKIVQLPTAVCAAAGGVGCQESTG